MVAQEILCEDTLDVHAFLGMDILACRADGQRVGEQILLRLRGLANGQMLACDFSRILRAEYLALREVVALTYPAVVGPASEEKYLVFRADEEHVDLFDALNLIAQERRCIVPVFTTTGNWRVAGRLTRADRDTLAFLMESRTLTARQLREGLQLLPSAASNRLRKLHQLRIIRREERILAETGGREFIYRPLFSSCAHSLRGSIVSGADEQAFEVGTGKVSAPGRI